MGFVSTSKAEHRFRTSENKTQSRMTGFGVAEKWRQLHIVELHNLHASSKKTELRTTK
jgi:hypothetical protein